MKSKKSGFTLIEVIISLALLAIILAIVNSIFVPSQKNISKTEVKSDLQLEAQNVLEYINKTGMQAEKIQEIKKDSNDYLASSDANISINSLIFNIGSENYGFKLENYDSNNETYELNYREPSTGKNTSVGKYVKDIKVSVVNGGTYETCSALSITIYLSKKGLNNEEYNYNVTTKVYFRNKK